MPVTLGRRYSTSPFVTPLPFGLLSVAEVITDPDPHWQAGIEFQPDACIEALSTYDGCPATGGPGNTPTKSPSVTGVGTFAAEPFTVYAEIQCSPVGVWEEIELRTSTALTNGEGRTVEDVFWTGTAGGTADIVHPHLAENTEIIETVTGVILQTAATPVTTGAAVDIVEAMGLLEGALGECYPGIGVIHVPRAALAHLAAWNLVRQDGARLRTTLGDTLVAAYASGNRQGPTGADPAAGQAWFYATGALNVRRSGIRFASSREQALDRSENTMRHIAERTYVVNWDCCHLAAQVSLGGITSGGSQAA